jgi:hypothetical protein
MGIVTFNILPVSFLQEMAVTETILARTIRAGIYADDGSLLSDQFVFNFNITDAINRQREIKHIFQMSAIASSEYKNQSVKLILEEPIEGTTRWRHYKDYFYTLNISFINDFDG